MDVHSDHSSDPLFICACTTATALVKFYMAHAFIVDVVGSILILF